MNKKLARIRTYDTGILVTLKIFRIASDSLGGLPKFFAEWARVSFVALPVTLDMDVYESRSLIIDERFTVALVLVLGLVSAVFALVVLVKFSPTIVAITVV